MPWSEIKLSTEQITEYEKVKNTFIVSDPSGKLLKMYIVSTFTEIMGLRMEKHHSKESLPATGDGMDLEKLPLNQPNPNYSKFLGLIDKFLTEKSFRNYSAVRDFCLSYYGVEHDDKYYSNYLPDVRQSKDIHDALYYLASSVNSAKIIYYYQTIAGSIQDILNQKPLVVTHIHPAAVHFGKGSDGIPYIHFNDTDINSPAYDMLWEDLKRASALNIKIVLMIGGAGLAYGVLFSDFPKYYALLKNTLKTHEFISGVDLDIEEPVKLIDVQLLIRTLAADFGSKFIISMAPQQTDLQTDNPGMGGFVYKDLYNSPEGKRINYFNTQFYLDFSVESYTQIINNGYPADLVVMGMNSNQFNSDTFSTACSIVHTLSHTYPEFSGVFNWEYYSSPPNPSIPTEWSAGMNAAIEGGGTSSPSAPPES